MKIRFLCGQEAFSHEFDPNTTIAEFFPLIKQKFGIPFSQQRLSFKDLMGNKIVLGEQQKTVQLKHASLDDQDTVYVLNIGKQIRWDYVFYLEYLGPIIIVPAFYYLSGKKEQYSLRQHMGAIMGTLHFVKRELQTAFVHVFSRKTMPLKRLFINSSHYWILFGLLNSIELFMYPKKLTYNKSYAMILFLLWGLTEFLNLRCHLELSSFRKGKGKQGKKNRGIPKGWGFQFVSCANYLWETFGWLLFSILTRNWTGFLFTLVSALQMGEWAVKKHKNYKREFENYPKNRKAFIPFLI